MRRALVTLGIALAACLTAGTDAASAQVGPNVESWGYVTSPTGQANVTAYQWSGGAWRSYTYRNGTQVYLRGWSTAWTWTWTQSSGWLAMSSRDLSLTFTQGGNAGGGGSTVAYAAILGYMWGDFLPAGGSSYRVNAGELAGLARAAGLASNGTVVSVPGINATSFENSIPGSVDTYAERMAFIARVLVVEGGGGGANNGMILDCYYAVCGTHTLPHATAMVGLLSQVGIGACIRNLGSGLQVFATRGSDAQIATWFTALRTQSGGSPALGRFPVPGRAPGYRCP